MSYKLRSSKKTEQGSYSLSGRSRKKTKHYDPCCQDHEKNEEKLLKDLVKSHIPGPIKLGETHEFSDIKNNSDFTGILKNVKKVLGKGYSCRKNNVRKMKSVMNNVGSKHCLYMFKCKRDHGTRQQVKVGRTCNSDSRFSTYRKDGVEIIGNIHYWMIL